MKFALCKKFHFPLGHSRGRGACFDLRAAECLHRASHLQSQFNWARCTDSLRPPLWVHARYNARIKGSILEKLCEANYARNPKKRLSRCWTFSVENGIRCRWKAFEKNFLYLSLFICLARISSSRKWNSLLFNPLRFKCRNYERESQELAFDFSLSLNHRRFIFHPELTMLQSFINWNDIYKSSAMEKVKVDLDKMVWMFKKKKKLFRIRG